MKKLKFKFNKELCNKVKDEVNLIIFNMKGTTFEDLKLVNQIMEELENVKITLHTC